MGDPEIDSARPEMSGARPPTAKLSSLTIFSPSSTSAEKTALWNKVEPDTIVVYDPPFSQPNLIMLHKIFKQNVRKLRNLETHLAIT